MKSIKNKIFKIIQPADNSSILSKMFDLVIVTLILINTVTIIAATFSLSALKIRIFLIIEIVSVIIFSVEYILRLWTADLLYPEKKPLQGTGCRFPQPPLLPRTRKGFCLKRQP